MPVATSPSAAAQPRPSKMEERKRAISHTDEIAPPSKRQAVNGSNRSRDDAGDMREENWIEEYQKGAIYRQMLEYKREKSTLESRLEEVKKRVANHDDHIRIIDAWWLQLVQEIELLVDGTFKSHPHTKDFSLSSGLAFKDNKEFQRQLGEQGNVVKSKIDTIFSRLASLRGDVKPEITELESQVKSLLAVQKEYFVKLARANAERENLSEQLDTATLRYIKAEKKLDRTKSAQVQKLEQQALANATRPVTDVTENGAEPGESNGDSEALRLQYQETQAVVAKQKEQVDSLLSEIKSLQEENSNLKAHRESLTDEEYVRTDVFKHFKSQNEDLIKRINHLEATNKQLREEAQRFQEERTIFKDQLEREAQAVTQELEDQIQAKEQDLTRIRSLRDEFAADIAIRKASQERDRAAFEHLKELVSAKDDRIAAIELELERLRPSEDVPMTDPREDIEALALDELRAKYLKLERDFESINKELPSIEKAYKKSAGLAQKKVMDFAVLEERLSNATADKGKAEQKYFAARKDMDIRSAENRSLRVQNGRSAEIIDQLKRSGEQSRTLLTNLEKQIVDLKQSNASILEENRTLKATSTDAVRRAEAIKNQVVDLTSLVKSKDTTHIATKERAVATETEAEKLKVRLEHIQKDRDLWKTKCQSNSSQEEDMLRQMMLCAICRNNFKNTVLKTCGHVFCQACVESRLSSRLRKCPTCSIAFGQTDVMAAHL